MVEMILPALAAVLASAGAQTAGKSAKVKQFPTMDARMRRMLEWAGQRSQQMTQNPLEGFGPIAQAATSAYKTNVIPGIMERFGGSGSTLSSPSLEASLNSAGTDLQERLAALGSQYAQNREGMAQNWMRLASQPTFQNVMIPGGHTALSAGLGAIGNMAGTATGMGLSDWYNAKQTDRISAMFKNLMANQQQDVEPEFTQETIRRMVDPLAEQRHQDFLDFGNTYGLNLPAQLYNRDIPLSGYRTVTGKLEIPDNMGFPGNTQQSTTNLRQVAQVMVTPKMRDVYSQKHNPLVNILQLLMGGIGNTAY